MATFRQFTKWYVESLDNDEVLEVLESVGVEPRGSGPGLEELSLDRKRALLVRVWNHRKGGIEVSRYLEENRHPMAVQDVRNRSLAEVDDNLEELLSIHGLQALAFALVVNPDEFKQNTGFRLIDEYGERLAEFPGPPLPEEKKEPVKSKSGADDQAIAESAINPVDLASEALQSIKQGCVIDVKAMDEVLGLLTQAWESYKEKYQEKGEMLSAISVTLKPSFEEELRFQEVLDLVPLRIESYQKLPVGDLASVTALLSDLDSLCNEAGDLRMQETSNMTERRELDEKLNHANRQIIDKATAISAFFDGASFGDQTDSSADDEPDPDAPIAASLPPEGSQPIPESESLESVQSSEEKGATVPLETAEPVEVAETGEILVDHSVPSDPDPPPPHSSPGSGILVEQDTIKRDTESADQVQSADSLMIWKLVAEGDFATSYWLSKEQGSLLDGILPDWSLLALVLGSAADWSRGDAKLAWYDKIGMPHPRPVQEIMTSAGIGTRASAFIVLSAALRPAVLAPETAAYDWIKDASSYLKSGDPLKSLLDTVFDFAHQGQPLNLGITADSGRDGFIQDAARAAESVSKWVSDASASRLMYPHTTRVLTHLASDNGPLADVFEVVRENAGSHDDVARVKEMLGGQLKDRQSMEALIDATNQSLTHSGPRIPAIHSKALEQLLRKLDSLKRELEDWVYATTNLGFSLEGYDWQVAHSREFRSNFLEHWSDVNDQLEALTFETGGNSDARLTGERAVYSVARHVLGAFVSHTLSEGLPTESINRGSSSHWQLELGRPLWRLSLPPVNEEGWPADLDDDFRPLEPFIEVVREGRSLESAFRLHLASNDFMAANLILSEIESQGTAEGESLAQELRRKLSEAQLVLKDRTAETRRQLEQATIDHVLSDDARSHLDGKLLSIEETETTRLAGAFMELDQIRQDLDRLRQERISSLREWIDDLNEELGAGDSNGLHDTTKAAKYVSLAYEALDRGDIPLADEYLHYGEQAQAGKEIEIEGQTKPTTAPVEFVRVLDRINQALESGDSPRFLANQLAKGQSAGGLDMRAVPGARYREIKEGLRAWFDLKRSSKSANVNSVVRAILTYLGFQDPKISLVDSVASTPDSYHYEAEMSAGNLSPLANFGSARNGLYHVVVVYGRPSAETMGLALQHYRVSSLSPIILFMGRMPLRQREEWSEYCRSHSITAMLVDELLMHFLAAQRESRLPAAVSCGVAWGYLVPYQASGVIPPEIFKGRHVLVHDLADTNGRLTVYGGRQFGKSALLRMVQRQYHNPARNFHVMYDDIRQIGHPENMLHPSDIWPRLRSWLISIGLLSSRVSEDRDRLAREIIRAMNTEEHRTWRVIILLDEADNFLNEDARSDFPELSRLKSIMDQTDMRLKVILSGLHGVQRFYVHENHPFAQLREPIVIGPLEPQAAQQLVIEPMSALGFDFSDSEQMTAVLRILCYTNYHPALIQGFCQELVKLVRLGNDSPPYKVTMSHVEAVYRRPEVRRQMQERFEWTLDLDSRYTAIVYCMILDQIQNYDGYRREYFAHEILQLLRGFWPVRLSALEIDEAKTLLEELIGLGVLVRRPNGKYRLRNGNVARALGSPDEILERATKLDEKVTLPDSTGRQLRFSLDVEKGIRSPLTVEQISNLSQGRSGVALVFGSDALGINLVHDSLNVAAQAQRAAHVEMACDKLPPECVSGEQLLIYLRNKMLNRRKGRHLLHWDVEQLSDGDSLIQAVDEAMEMLSKGQGRNRSIRLVITLGPRIMRDWFRCDAEALMAVESRADMLIKISRWDSHMIEQFYQDFDVKAPTREILEVTGGWPWLIDQLNLLVGGKRRGWDASDLRDATSQVQLMLKQNQDNMRDEFVAALGVNEVPGARAILRLVREWKNLKLDEMSYAVGYLGDGELDDWPREKILGLVGMLGRLGLLKVTDGSLAIEPVSADAVANYE